MIPQEGKFVKSQPQAAHPTPGRDGKEVTELHRKSLIRLMNGSLERQPRQKQRGATYGPEVDDALQVIAESSDYLCAERLTPNLVWLAEHLAAHGELETTPHLLQQEHIRQDQPRLPRKGPEQANRVTRDISMTRIPWDEPQLGHFEVDLVHRSKRAWAGLTLPAMCAGDVPLQDIPATPKIALSPPKTQKTPKAAFCIAQTFSIF